jgi:hypothetical protein
VEELPPLLDPSPVEQVIMHAVMAMR